MSHKIRVLGADWCPYCVKVAKHLKNKNVAFDWVDTNTEAGNAERQNLSKQYNFKTIPMVFVDGEFIGGCDDFFSAINRKKIQI